MQPCRGEREEKQKAKTRHRKQTRPGQLTNHVECITGPCNTDYRERTVGRACLIALIIRAEGPRKRTLFSLNEHPILRWHSPSSHHRSRWRQCDHLFFSWLDQTGPKLTTGQLSGQGSNLFAWQDQTRMEEGSKRARHNALSIRDNLLPDIEVRFVH